jgi:hypothetical protein
LVSTAIVAISECYIERLAIQGVKARLFRALTWTFVVPQQDARHNQPNNDRDVAPTNPDDYPSLKCALPLRLSSAPFLGELAREMGGFTGFRQKRDIVSAARRATRLGQEDRFLVSKRYGVVSNWDQDQPNTKRN